MAWSFTDQPQSQNGPGACQESPPGTQATPRVSGALCQELRQRPSTHFLCHKPVSDWRAWGKGPVPARQVGGGITMTTLLLSPRPASRAGLSYGAVVAAVQAGISRETLSFWLVAEETQHLRARVQRGSRQKPAGEGDPVIPCVMGHRSARSKPTQSSTAKPLKTKTALGRRPTEGETELAVWTGPTACSNRAKPTLSRAGVSQHLVKGQVVNAIRSIMTVHFCRCAKAARDSM